jgi:hypothetical protein
MKSVNQFIVVAAIAGGTLSQTIHADLITGDVQFTGGITYDTDSAGTATAITAWVDPFVTLTSGTFANGPYSLSNHAAATFSPLTWNLNTSTPITNFWNVGGFKFELFSSQIIAQQPDTGFSLGYMVVGGPGIVSGNGFTPTAFSWSITSSDPGISTDPESWTFAASVNSLNSNGAPVLVSRTITNAVVLSWNDPTFALQAAPAASGTFTNIPAATSPYTNIVIGAQQFFRLDQP